MLCYYYPPIVTSGVARSYGFVRELAKNNWKQTVLTVRNPADKWVGKSEDDGSISNVTVVRSSELNITKVVDFFHGATSRFFSLFKIDLQKNYYRDLLCIPDTQISWFTFFIGIRLAKTVEVIYVSCSPFSASVKAVLIKLFSKKPLVVDLRDAWAINPVNTHTAFHSFISKLLERLVVYNCDRLIANTHGAEKLYLEHYPQHKDKITMIPNGFDELNLASKKTPDTKFTIMHVGSFYGLRQPNKLLEALKRIGNSSIKFIQLGNSCDVLETFADDVEIEVINTVPREKALELMKTVSVLYLNQGATDIIPIAAKTYEYLTTGLPIIAECPEGDNSQVVSKYGINSFIVTDGSVDKLEEAVRKTYAERESFKPEVNEEFIRLFSREALAEELEKVLNLEPVDNMKRYY